jgi:hypothetical protein
MITVKLMACASSVIRDADSNQISIFNIIDGVAAHGFPFLIQQFAVIVILQRDPATDPADHEATFQLRLGDQVLAEGNAAVRFDDKRHTRQILRMQGLVVPAPGTLQARFTMGTLSETYEIFVEPMTPAQLELLAGGNA